MYIRLSSHRIFNHFLCYLVLHWYFLFAFVSCLWSCLMVSLHISWAKLAKHTYLKVQLKWKKTNYSFWKGIWNEVLGDSVYQRYFSGVINLSVHIGLESLKDILKMTQYGVKSSIEKLTFIPSFYQL